LGHTRFRHWDDQDCQVEFPITDEVCGRDLLDQGNASVDGDAANCSVVGKETAKYTTFDVPPPGEELVT
jgi:hypothetical protein